MSINLCGFQDSLKIAAAGNKKETEVSGYYAVYGTTSELIYGFMRWKWEAGCFEETLKVDDQWKLYQHDWTMVIGRKSAGTASFSSDGKGLFASGEPELQWNWAVGMLASIKRGDITAGSVGFNIKTSDWSMEDGYDIQHLRKCKLSEASPVTRPAFKSTDGLILVSMLPSNIAEDEKAPLLVAMNRSIRDLNWISNDDKERLRYHRSAMEANLTPQMVASLDRHGVNVAPIISVPKVQSELAHWEEMGKFWKPRA